MTYDPLTYWRERGKVYEAKLTPGIQDQQEAVLREFLGTLKFGSVLDVGCGFGRLGLLIAEVRPDAEYTGIDVSPDMLASARAKLPAGEFVETTLADFEPGRKWDLVLCVQVLMHQRPAEIEAAVTKLRSLSRRHIVTVDWARPLVPPRRIAGHNFLYDWRALFGPKAKEIELGSFQSLWHINKAFGG